jgi:hypothetical protein
VFIRDSGKKGLTMAENISRRDFVRQCAAAGTAGRPAWLAGAIVLAGLVVAVVVAGNSARGTTQQKRAGQVETSSTLADRLDEVFAAAVREHAEATKQLASLPVGKSMRYGRSLNPQRDTSPGFDPKDFTPWTLTNATVYGGACLNRSATMEQFVHAASKSAELADLLRQAAARLVAPSAQTRGVACEFLAHFPRQTLEAGLLPAVGAALDDDRFSFDAARLGLGQSATYIARLDKGMSVAGLADRMLRRATTLTFPSRKAFEKWWPQNKDYTRRLWYWAMRWQSPGREPPALTDVADMDPARGLRVLLLAGNEPAVLADAGLHESSRINSRQAPGPDQPRQWRNVRLWVPPAAVGEYIAKHKLKTAVIDTLHGEVPWPEARGKDAFSSLVHTVTYVLPHICDKSDVPRLMPLLGRHDEPLVRVQAELAMLVAKLDPAAAEAVIVRQLEAGLPAPVPELIRISGLKHRNLIHKLGPGRDSLNALAALGTPETAALIGQWLNERGWTVKLNDLGYETDTTSQSLFLTFVEAARIFNGGKPVIDDELLARSRFRIGKWTKQEWEKARPHNLAVPAHRAEAIRRLQAFFAAKAKAASAVAPPAGKADRA